MRIVPELLPHRTSGWPPDTRGAKLGHSHKRMLEMGLARKILYSIGGLIALVFAIGVVLPSSAEVERRVEIGAHPATVFALLNDFRQVNKWSPWTNTDPNARFDIGGPPRGVGASLTWDGDIVGSGRQVIVESVPFERVVSELELDDRGHALATFELIGIPAGTEVVWRFETRFGFDLLARYFGLMLDSVVGDDYEKGLARLKSMAESLPGADFGDIEIEHVVVEETEIAYLPTTSVPEPTAIAESMGQSYFRILSFIDEHGLTDAGAPISISRGFSGSDLMFDAAIPVRGVTGDTPRSGTPVRIGQTYGGPVIRVKHVGPYRELGLTHDKIAAYLAALGIERNGDAWESYASDPTRTAESELLTFVYYPVRE